tara:strand:- start:1384 stop:1539 length:156 start_codon:yes stop_codon:yes gene_type:complete
MIADQEGKRPDIPGSYNSMFYGAFFFELLLLIIGSNFFNHDSNGIRMVISI